MKEILLYIVIYKILNKTGENYKMYVKFFIPS